MEIMHRAENYETLHKLFSPVNIYMVLSKISILVKFLCEVHTF